MTIVFLGLVLPALYVAALRVRRDMPVGNALAESVSRVGVLEERGRSIAVAWEGAKVVVSLLQEGAVLELQAVEDPERPDVLVYWRAGAAGDEAPSDGSFLLGPLAGTQARRYALPDAARTEAGTLTLFSLAHGEVVAHGPLPATGGGS